MRNIFRLPILVILFLCLATNSFAQNQSKIIGSVGDSSKPLSLVTVRLLAKGSSNLLQTVLTKEDGSFQLRKPAPGDYVLSCTHTGYNERQLPVSIPLSPDDFKIEKIEMSKTSAMMNEVVIKTSRPLVEQSDDKVVFNVEDDPASKTETAIDILRRTPFISVDGEDNVKINGKSNFKVLLNGRETSMFARNIKEALRGFPGALISKIEVITTPSAKYDGEGIGGLINIITKKKVVGYNGTLSSFNRTSDKVNSYSINANAKLGKVGFSVFFSSGYSNPVRQHSINTTIPTLKNIYTKRTLEGDQFPKATWNFGNAEFSWEVDSLNTISVYGNTDSWSSKTKMEQVITTEFSNAPTTTSFYHLNNDANNPGVNVGSDYIKHFKRNKEQEFSLRFLGEFGKNDAKLNSFQDNPGTDRYLVNNSYAKNDQITIQADNSIPLNKISKLEGGVKAILRRASSDFQSLVKYDELSDFKTNPANTDYFKYTQNVVGVYSMYSIRFKKSNIRVGARLEFTDVNGNFVTSHTQVKNNYTTLLPNLQYTNKVSNVTTIVLGYTKRLQRPYIWDLNPFVYNNDSLNISFGNPDLGPQTIHAISAQIRFAKGMTFAGVNVESSYSGNKILQYSSFDPQTGITKTTSLNIGKEFQSSLNLNFNTNFTQKWRVFINGSLRYATIRNNSNTSQSNTGFGCNFNFSTSYRFNDRFTISSYLGLWQEPQTIQTTYPFNVWHNVAFNYKMFNNKINISLRGVNYYEKTHDFKTITKDQNFYNSNVNRQIRRGGVLALTWNFGKLTENVSKKKGVANDDMLTKPQAPGGN